MKNKTPTTPTEAGEGKYRPINGTQSPTKAPTSPISPSPNVTPAFQPPAAPQTGGGGGGGELFMFSGVNNVFLWGVWGKGMSLSLTFFCFSLFQSKNFQQNKGEKHVLYYK